MSQKLSRVTHISPLSQSNQFVRSLKPLWKAGVLRQRSVRDNNKVLKILHRYGMSLAGLIEQAHIDFPGRLAIIDDFGELTYDQLRDKAKNLALNIYAQGIREGDTIAIQARNSRAMVLGLLASAYLGTRPMIVNVASSKTQITNIFADYGADFYIVDAEYADIATANAHVPHAIVEGAVPQGKDPSDPAYAPEGTTLSSLTDSAPAGVELPSRPVQQPTVIMSSGTYGIPKGVVLPVPKTPKVLGGVVNAIPWHRHMVVQLTASMFHAWGWLNAQIGLSTGSTLVLRRYYDPQEALDDIVHHGVTCMVSAAVFLRQLISVMDERHVDVTGIEFIVSSGNAIPKHLVQQVIERFGPVLYNFYGSTEHGQIAISNSEELLLDSGCVGKPTMGIELKIYKEDGSEAAQGELGRVYSANSMTMAGFLSERDQAEVRDGLLFTGDLGYLDEEGRLHLQGRADDMVIKGGENVFPREVEAYLSSLDIIDDVYVMGVQDDVIAHLDAYIIRSETGRDVTEDDIRDLVRDALAEHNVPDNVYWVDELPRNDGGKVVPRWLLEQQKKAN